MQIKCKHAFSQTGNTWCILVQIQHRGKLDWILVLCYLCIILLWLITFVGQCHNLFWGFGISLKNLDCQGIFRSVPLLSFMIFFFLIIKLLQLHFYTLFIGGEAI